jgi:glycolate oxidase FAD binding subunit
MLLEPANVSALQQQLADASARGIKILDVNVQSLNGIIEYTPEDMVITCQTGIKLDDLQSKLREHRQWLPIDPPEPRVTLAEIISANLSGPRRLGYGTIRDHVLGLSILMADGTLISGGGKVVKNVAGFDLPKLFIGARGSLGIPIEASFKLLPLPESEGFASATLKSLTEASQIIERINNARLWPTNFDLYQLVANGPLHLLAGFAGAKEDVKAQIKKASGLGLSEQGSITEQAVFWTSGAQMVKHSFLPSDLLREIAQIAPDRFLARIGNGILFLKGPMASARTLQAPALMKSLKETFDPQGILPEFAF